MKTFKYNGIDLRTAVCPNDGREYVSIKDLSKALKISHNTLKGRAVKNNQIVRKYFTFQVKDNYIRNLVCIPCDQIPILESSIDWSRSAKVTDDKEYEYKTQELWESTIKIAIDTNNIVYVPVRELCKSLNINFNNWNKKIQGDNRFNAKLIPFQYTSLRNCACIPLDEAELFKSNVRWKSIGRTKNFGKYTYILWDGKSDFVKIGKTDRPIHRLKEHQSSHKSLQIIYLIEGNKEEFFKENYDYLRIDNNTEHYWLTPQLMEAWEQFEDVNSQFF